MSKDNAKEAKKESVETRVFEVNRRVKVTEESTETLVYKLNNGEWFFSTNEAHEFNEADLEAALGQLRKLNART